MLKPYSDCGHAFTLCDPRRRERQDPVTWQRAGIFLIRSAKVFVEKVIPTMPHPSCRTVCPLWCFLVYKMNSHVKAAHYIGIEEVKQAVTVVVTANFRLFPRVLWIAEAMLGSLCRVTGRVDNNIASNLLFLFSNDLWTYLPHLVYSAFLSFLLLALISVRRIELKLPCSYCDAEETLAFRICSTMICFQSQSETQIPTIGMKVW